MVSESGLKTVDSYVTVRNTLRVTHTTPLLVRSGGDFRTDYCIPVLVSKEGVYKVLNQVPCTILDVTPKLLLSPH